MISSIPFLIPLFFSYSTAASSPPFFTFYHFYLICYLYPGFPLYHFFSSSFFLGVLWLYLYFCLFSIYPHLRLPVCRSRHMDTLFCRIYLSSISFLISVTSDIPPPNTSCNLLRYISRVYHVLRPYVLCLVCFRFPYSPMLAAVRVLFFLLSSLLSFLLFISGPRVSFVFLSIRLSGPEQGGKVSYWQS